MSNAPYTHHIEAKGMSCQHCVNAVTKAIQALDAGAIVNVDLPRGVIDVQTSLSREATTRAISDEGYEVIQ